MTFRVLVAVLLAAPALAGPPAAPGEPRYSSVNLTPEILAKHPDAELSRQFVGFAKQFKVTEIKRIGANAKTVWSGSDAATDTTPEMNRTERLAMLALLQRAGMLGVESDVLIEQADKTLVPVSITWDPSGVISYKVGAPVKDLLDPAVTADQIREKFGVGEITEEGAKWAPGELAAVQQALALLTPEELALAKGFGFRRMKAGGGTSAAFYHRQDSGVMIDVFDILYSSRRSAFIGSPDAPMADPVRTLLHELAHAIADSQGRAIALVANAAVADARAAQAKMKEAPSDETKLDANQKTKVANELRKKSNASDKAEIAAGGRLVEREFAKILDPAKSVTQYGRTNQTESFAEAFWMFKADLDALKRLSPAAVEWFTAGNHVKVAAKPF